MEGHIIDSPVEQIILPQVIAVAFQEANTAPGSWCQTPTYFGALAGSPGPAKGRIPPPCDGDLQWCVSASPHAPASCGPLGSGVCGGGARGTRVCTRKRPGRRLDWGCTAACTTLRPLPTILCSGSGVLTVLRPRCAAHSAGGKGRVPGRRSSSALGGLLGLRRGG